MNFKVSEEERFLLKVIKSYYSKELLSESEVDQIDLEKFIDLAKAHKVLIPVYLVIKDYLPIHISKNLEEEIKILKLRQERKIKEIEKIITKAKESNISFVVVKGFIYSQLIFNDPFIRLAGDIDIILDDSDIETMHKIMKDLGYFQLIGKGGEENVILDYPILKHYRDFKGQSEYHEYYKVLENGQKVKVELQRSIHTTVKAQKLNEFLNNIQQVKVLDIDIPTFDTPYLFLYMLENVYTDSEKIGGPFRLKEYLDLLAFIQKYNMQINWSHIQHLSNQFGMLHLIHRVLKNLLDIFGQVLPDEVNLLFELKNATYDYSHSPSGYLLEWKSDIFQRVFNKVDRNKEILDILNENTYSLANINFNKPLQTQNFKDGITSNLHLKTFVDDKYGYSYSYCPAFDGTNLYFIFKLDMNVISNIGQFEIVIHFIETPPSYNQRKFVVTKQNESIFVSYDDNIVRERFPVYLNNDYLITKIPNILNYYKGMIAFNIYIQEWINLINTPASRSFALIIGSENIMGSFKTYWNPSILQIISV